MKKALANKLIDLLRDTDGAVRDAESPFTLFVNPQNSGMNSLTFYAGRTRVEARGEDIRFLLEKLTRDED